MRLVFAFVSLNFRYVTSCSEDAQHHPVYQQLTTFRVHPEEHPKTYNLLSNKILPGIIYMIQGEEK